MHSQKATEAAFLLTLNPPHLLLKLARVDATAALAEATLLLIPGSYVYRLIAEYLK